LPSKALHSPKSKSTASSLTRFKAIGRAHTVLYITVKEDKSDRDNLENVQYKYLKVPAWMFHRTITNGTKGLAHF